ncbi:MAG: glucosaminidase domain-containing protein [Bacteroidales bacterium]|jgi:flagellum-specific peptidoglycan hydrolase FlgJ|nr:glucosaminidase domain-containing protein [Bacteroidales bacterium]
MSKEKKFIDQYSEAIVLSTLGTPLLPSVKMAQAALETGWGRSTVGEAKNLFGIKASGSFSPYWKGNAITASTKENYGDGNISIVDKFRAYSSIQDSIKDHSHLLLTLSRYARVRDAQTPEEQAKALQSCGYATDPGYANKLINIIKQYNLETLDEKKSYEIF